MPDRFTPSRPEDHLARLRIHPGELDAQSIALFVPEFARIDQEKDHRLENIAKIIAENGSIHAAATALMQLEPWDFMGVYYDGIDHFCHGFMNYHPPPDGGRGRSGLRTLQGGGGGRLPLPRPDARYPHGSGR